MFDGVICKYFGGGLSVYILESNIKLVSIYMHKSNFQKGWGGGGGRAKCQSIAPSLVIGLIYKGFEVENYT